MSILRIALDVPLTTLFDYSGTALPGQLVLVPFGRGQRVGVVLARTTHSEVPADKLKPIVQVLDDRPVLSPGLLRLLQFCADYYRHPIGQTVMTALPALMRQPEALPQPWCYASSGVDWAQLPPRKKVARRVLQVLGEQPLSPLALRPLATPAQLHALEEEGLIVRVACPSAATPAVAPLCNAHALTPAQQAVCDAVTASSGYACFLLHGITGSGKTEVYVHLMQHALQRGQQVLLLVPEINLTPQLEGYFQQRFPNTPLVSLHSGLTDRQRWQHWQQAQRGQARIVLGTRLAVFAELPQLGLIVVDEEHDGSFKQQDGLRYSARDVAVFRAHQAGVPIVLGSATPSLESYHNAQAGRYRLLQLHERAQPEARLPTVRCLPLKIGQFTQGISHFLLEAIEARLQRGEQSLLFINRRGYAPVLRCGECGWLSGCRHCAGKMVLHLDQHRLRCHHCGAHSRVPTACPDCGHAELLPLGSGTQRVEQVLQQRFPQARILRVDRDSTQGKRTWSDMQAQIRANEVDILVGTQMLVKGHDFPDLTLVGVLNPDSALYSSDFRAGEKLFAQLMQVAGRAGRADKAGEVLVQTAFPEHPLYRALQRHDFAAWAEVQLAERRMAAFPPYVHQVMLRAEGREESAVYAWLEQARAAALQLQAAVEVFGVVPAALPRRANHLRAQLLIQASQRRALQQFLRDWQLALAQLPAGQLRITLDVDPQEF